MKLQPSKSFRSGSSLASHAGAVAFPFAALLGACSGDAVNMGEDTAVELPPPYSVCAENPTLSGDVVVHNQDELNALEGCEVVEGDLNVVPFAGADLRPLHALTAVGGLLSFSEPPPADGWVTPAGPCISSCIEPAIGATPSDWLSSLEGLESLETVGSLRIVGLSASDVEPLQNLRSLTDGGYLSLTKCHNLRDLNGLRNVTGILDLEIIADSLETIAALQLPRQMNSVHLEGASLRDLGTFPVRGVLNFLKLVGSSLENLDPLAELDWVGTDLSIRGNPLLTNMDGLNGLVSAGALHVSNNDSLERFPEFTALEHLRAFSMYNNDVLHDLSAFHAAHHRVTLRPTLLSLDWSNAEFPDYIDISGNPALESFAMPMRWRFGELVRIVGNDNLRHLDLGSFETMDWLWISDNQALESVEHARLGTIDKLQVEHNPSLLPSAFDGIPRFETIMVGNAGQTQL